MERKEPKTDVREQDEQLREMNYSPSEDIFNKESHISLDGDGNPLEKSDEYSMEADLDVPGSDEDNAQEAIGEEDEENNYWSIGGEDHEDLEQSEDF